MDMNKEGLLAVGSLLNGGKYRILKHLSSGGFGKTYLAENVELEQKFVIKEHFIKGVCGRDATSQQITVTLEENRASFEALRDKFRKEARRLSSLKNPHIVNVHDLFDENGTSYYVMDYIDGESLSSRLKRTGQPLTEAEVMALLPQVLDALQAVHAKNIWHLDLKPGNIMVDREGQAHLIDFGASKQLVSENGEQLSTSSAMAFTPGYASTEQMYQSIDKFGPWTDLYSLGATLFNLLTCRTPPTPADISEDAAAAFAPLHGASERMRHLIKWLMQPNRPQRPQSAAEVLDYLAKEKDEPAKSATSPEPKSDEHNAKKDDTPSPVADEATVIRGSSPDEDAAKKAVPQKAGKSEGLLSGCIAAGVAALIVLFLVMSGVKKMDEKEDDSAVNDAETEIYSRDMVRKMPPPDESGSSSSLATTGSHRGHDWVDLGLPSGTKWATTNVGASSPSDYGSYFAWGETSTKSSYGWSNLKYCIDSSNLKFSKYVTDSDYGNVDGKKELDLSDDVAYVNWGQGWRMPSLEQIEELKEKCQWTWTSMGAHSGYKVVGKNGNSIFLPAAGYWSGSSSGNVGSRGSYWSRTLDTSGGYFAYYIYFNSDYVDWRNCVRYYGLSVRAVRVSTNKHVRRK